MAVFHKKARLWVHGRKGVFERLVRDFVFQKKKLHSTRANIKYMGILTLKTPFRNLMFMIICFLCYEDKT